MKRSEALNALVSQKPGAISVATMRGVAGWHARGGADELHIDCIGCMGGAASLGLGLALAQPERKVIVVDGDGSLLMQLGVLAGIAGHRGRELLPRCARQSCVRDVRAPGDPFERTN